MNTYRWLPRQVILVNEKLKLRILRAALRKAHEADNSAAYVRIREVIEDQEKEVERYAR